MTLKTVKTEKNEAQEQDNIIVVPDLNCEFPTKGLGEVLFDHIQAHGNGTAQILAETGEEMSYGELLKRGIRTAIELRERGIESNSNNIVGMYTNNHLDAFVPFLAAQFLSVPFISWDPTESINTWIESVKGLPLKILFVSSDFLEGIQRAVEEIPFKIDIIVFGKSNKYTSYKDIIKSKASEKDFKVVPVADNRQTACIIFSSGTTGTPKGTCLNHFSLLAQAEYIKHHENIDEDLIRRETPLVSLPYKILTFTNLYWISTYQTFINSFIYGACVVIWSDFEAKEFFPLIEKYKILSILISLHHICQLLKLGRPKNLKITSPLRINTGGTIIPEKQILSLRKLIPEADIYQSYGLTEITGLATTFQTLNKQHRKFFMEKPSSCGLPVPGISYKVVDPETGEILGPNQIGELRVKTKMIMNGYNNKDCYDDFDSDGWFKTGDLVYYDTDKCFYVVDRLKDMFIYQSCNVQPVVIEKEILSNPAAKIALAFGIPHEEDGSHAMAVVVLEENQTISEQELLDYTNARLDLNYKLRAGLKIVKSMPASQTGKVKRRIIRDMVIEGRL